jgi:hypothetical protein
MKALAKKHREIAIAAQERTNRAKKREKERAKRAKANEQTPDGFNANMRAKLQAAQQRAESDPRAAAIVREAQLQQQVEQLRIDKGIGIVSPPIFAGEPAIGGRPVDLKTIPKSVAESLSVERAEVKPEPRAAPVVGRRRTYTGSHRG